MSIRFDLILTLRFVVCRGRVSDGTPTTDTNSKLSVRFERLLEFHRMRGMKNVEFREQQTKDCAGCEYALADLPAACSARNDHDRCTF